MSFKNNIGSPFRPAVDPFGGRGERAGLNHGGQYSVDYVVEKPKTTRKQKPKTSPTSGQRPFMRSAPPVAAPRPTKQEVAKMKSASGIDDVSVDNENFVNLSGNKKRDIERGLARYTCVKTAHGSGNEDSCNGFHAIWQASNVKNCGAPVIASAKLKLDQCAGAQGGDVAQCTDGLADYAGLDKRQTRLYVQEVANRWRNELENAVNVCLLSEGTNGDRDDNTIYGCTNRNAINYNPSANYDDGSCEYGTDDTPPDGNFDQIDDLINQKLASFLDGLQGNQSPTGGEESFQDQVDYGAPLDMQTPPMPPTKQAGLGNVNPLLLIGVIAVAGLVVFMANKKPQMGATKTMG